MASKSNAASPSAGNATETEPIDKQARVVSGKRVPLLDPSWITELRCVSYQPPPPPLSSQAAEDAWQERCQFLADDLTDLLSLPHWQFWCHVLHDRSVVGVMLDSYLGLAPRWHDRADRRGFSEPVAASLRRLHQLVFFVCLRLSTHRESPEHYISEPGFAELHSRIRLFTPARLMDICALYWRGNQQLIRKMVASLLRRLPWLAGELQSTAVTLGRRVLLESSQGSNQQQQQQGYCPDRLLFARDALETLNALVDAATGFPEVTDGLESILPQLYEALVPTARCALIAARQSGGLTVSSADLDDQMQAVHRLHSLCLSLYHRLWSDSLVCQKRAYSTLVGLSESVHSCRQFLAAAEADFKLSEELEAAENIDPELTGYIAKAVASAVAEFGARRSPPQLRTNGAVAAATAAVPEDDDEYADYDEGDRRLAGGVVNSAFTADDNDAEAGIAASRPDDVQLESLVSHVQDIFPHVGAGFIKECLRHYAYDTEKLINALLEDSLPPQLSSLDRTMLEAPSATVSRSNKTGQVEDAFNFASAESVDRDALRGRVHRGKRDDLQHLGQPADTEEERKMRQWLADWQVRLREAEDAEAEEEAALAAAAAAATAATTVAAIRRRDSAAYEDEFDDTYEAAALAPDRAAGGDSSSDDEEDEEAGDDQQQQQQQSQQQRQPTFDVRGTGKRGRGQSHRIVQNRQTKERDKGYRANHNRRALSDRKRAAGGMMF